MQVVYGEMVVLEVLVVEVLVGLQAVLEQRSGVSGSSFAYFVIGHEWCMGERGAHDPQK